MRFSAYSAEKGDGAGKIDMKNAVKKLQTLIFPPKITPEQFRHKIEETFSTVHIPSRVECEEKHIGNVPCLVLTPEIASSNRVVIYIHGGSFIGGSSKAWRSFCASFAAEASSKTIVPDFRLAPQSPYPGALEDVQVVFREIHNAVVQNRESSSSIIIAADGSGASIALALVQSMKENYRSAIRNIILFSPWLDLTYDLKNISDKKGSDGLVTVDSLIRSGELYTYRDNLSHPLISPLYISPEKLEKFPPVYMQCGGKELLLPKYQAFHQLLTQHGVDSVLDLWPDMIFMFQMAHEFIPQAHLAIQRVGRYIQNYKKEKD